MRWPPLGGPLGTYIYYLPNIYTKFGQLLHGVIHSPLYGHTKVCNAQEMGSIERSLTSAERALRGRLERGQLTEHDHEWLERTRAVRPLILKAKPVSEIANAVGMKRNAMDQFLKSGSFRVCADYLAEQELKGDITNIEEVVRKSRMEFAQLAPDTLDYYRDCFRRNPIEEQEVLGLWRDVDRAERAATQVAKGLGLTEPEHAARPVIHINLGHIQFQMRQVGEEDARAARVIDVTPSDQR